MGSLWWILTRSCWLGNLLTGSNFCKSKKQTLNSLMPSLFAEDELQSTSAVVCRTNKQPRIAVGSHLMLKAPMWRVSSRLGPRPSCVSGASAGGATSCGAASASFVPKPRCRRARTRSVAVSFAPGAAKAQRNGYVSWEPGQAELIRFSLGDLPAFPSLSLVPARGRVAEKSPQISRWLHF